VASLPKSDIVQVAIEIAQERSKLLGRVRAALEVGDNRSALKLMREYVGLSDAARMCEGTGREQIQ
jgi:hypothetical protein